MRYMTFALLKKRWYIFIILTILTILMNVVVWNNTTQMLRQLSTLQLLKQKSEEAATHYEILYMENTEEDGRIIPNSDEEYDQLSQVLLDTFYSKVGEEVLYTNKENYIFKDEELIPLTKEQMKQKLSPLKGIKDPGYFLREVLSDLIVINDNGLVLEDISNKLAEYRFDITFSTLHERYQRLYDYYSGGMRFAVIVYLVFFIFSFCLIYWLISTALKISQQDMRLLRIVGLPMKKLNRHYTLLFCSVIFLGFLIAMSFIHSLGFGVLLADYVYLIGLNAIFMLLVWGVTSRKIRRFFDA